MVSIGYAEFGDNYTEEPALGINGIVDEGLMRVGIDGAKQISKFQFKNKGPGACTITVKKRGKTEVIPAEVITGLQVGATNRVRGSLVKRRVTPGTIVITDSTGGTAQRVEDTNGDGILFQTDGPAGPTYPIQVGTIEYNNAFVDFTFNAALTGAVQINYSNTDWTDFGTPITFDLAAGGGTRDIVILPGEAQNWFAGLKDEEEIGWFGRNATVDARTSVGMITWYHGDTNDIQPLPFAKGEIREFPFHNA